MKKRIRFSIISQVAVFFMVGVLLSGTLSFLVQRVRTDASVKRQMEEIGSNIAQDVILSVKEYPAYNWLLSYWYIHHDALEVEYDASYGPGSRTEEKCRLLAERHPDLQLKYATPAELEMLPKLDQQIYAEITYSWLAARIDKIKQAYNVDYLFVLLTDEGYTTQFFLFSGADPDSVRGTKYMEVYPLGVTVTVVKNEDQQESMRLARQNSVHLARAGDFVDYYAFLGMVGRHTCLVGMTYNLHDLTSNIRSQTRRSTIYAVAFQIILALFCIGLIFRFVLNPLKAVSENIQLYKATKDSKRVNANLAQIHSQNEIGQLSEDISSLTLELDDYTQRIASITAERERIGTELDLATKIQTDMLPSVFPPFPDRHGFDIYAAMDPAKEVGGDFYDFFLIDDDHLCMFIADVSGKGIPAALFMMASMIILSNYSHMGHSPAQVLEAANNAICSNNRQQMFVTVWLGILELSTGKLTAANAGHEYPAIRRAGGQFELFKDRHGFVIGGMAGVKYRDYELQLNPGDELFVYTDGVPEATDENGRLFGTDRMLHALNGDGGNTPEQELGKVRRAVDSFVKEAEQFDDLTMLCLAYYGPEGRQE